MFLFFVFFISKMEILIWVENVTGTISLEQLASSYHYVVLSAVFLELFFFRKFYYCSLILLFCYHCPH